jgi:hypothetical protein
MLRAAVARWAVRAVALRAVLATVWGLAAGHTVGERPAGGLTTDAAARAWISAIVPASGAAVDS